MRCKNLHPLDKKVPNLGQAHLSLAQPLKTWRLFRDEDRLTAFTSCYVRFLHNKQVHGGMARSQQASPGVTRRHQAFHGTCIGVPAIACVSLNWKNHRPYLTWQPAESSGKATAWSHDLGHPTADWNSIGSYEGLAAWVWHGRNGSLLVHTPAYYEVLQLLNCLNSLTHWFLDAWEYPTAT